MDKNQCKHDWKIHAEAGRTVDGPLPAVYICDKCGLTMEASDVIQLLALENQTEALKHMTGFQKNVAIISAVFSTVALIISILTYINK